VKEVIEFANSKEIHQGKLEGGGYVLQHPLWKVAPDLLDLENHGEQGGRLVLPPLHQPEKSRFFLPGQGGEVGWGHWNIE
jgi:hypothetical protein